MLLTVVDLVNEAVLMSNISTVLIKRKILEQNFSSFESENHSQCYNSLHVCYSFSNTGVSLYRTTMDHFSKGMGVLCRALIIFCSSFPTVIWHSNINCVNFVIDLFMIDTSFSMSNSCM